MIAVAECISVLHAEFADVCHMGSNLQGRLNDLEQQAKALDKRRNEILRELRALVDPPGTDTLEYWGR